MASLGMVGPYELDKDTIDEKVSKKSPGNYALGKMNDGVTFLVEYVGRADLDVNGRLKSWVGKTKHPLFKFSYATSAKSAFEKECENYHDFDPPENDVHPDKPSGTNWKCPHCDIAKNGFFSFKEKGLI